MQKHIHKFGGDKTQVTIGGDSAGGGSVMLLAIAGDGKLGNSLFKQVRSFSTEVAESVFWLLTRLI